MNTIEHLRQRLGLPEPQPLVVPDDATWCPGSGTPEASTLAQCPECRMFQGATDGAFSPHVDRPTTVRMIQAGLAANCGVIR